MNYFSEESKIIRRPLLTGRTFHAQMNKKGKSWKSASSFITNQFFLVYEKKRDKSNYSLVLGLYEYFIQRLEGNPIAALGEKILSGPSHANFNFFDNCFTWLVF